jgi:hypothetical protein
MIFCQPAEVYVQARCDSRSSTTLPLRLSVFMVSSLKYRYDSQGFVVVPGLIRSEDFDGLKQACDRVISRTRSGSWKYRRTVGTQFPPWGEENPDSWGIQHVMHPDLGEPAFARWYTSKAVTQTAQELLNCEQDELQMGAFAASLFKQPHPTNQVSRAVQCPHQPRFAEFCDGMAQGWAHLCNCDQ